MMALRIPITCFKRFHTKNRQFICCMSSQLLPKYPFSTSPNKIQTSVSENTENIQYPKHVQPFANNSVDEILSILSSKHIAGSTSVSVLKMLRILTLFKNINSNAYISDERFKNLCSIFQDNCSRMTHSFLVSGLRSLLEIGVQPDSSCVISAEESIINNLKGFSTFNVIGCLYFHHKYMKTELQNQVVSLLVQELCKRISEVSSNSEVLMLVHFLHIFNAEDLKTVQERIVKCINILNSHEICKIFITLAEKSSRNVSILNALAFHLRHKIDTLQVKEILDILYAFKKLNFLDLVLVSNLITKATGEVPTIKQPSLISGLLISCGHLRLRHPGFLNECGNWIVSHIDVCRQKEFVSFILTTASLNYFTIEIQRALEAIKPLVTYEKLESRDVWLDVVWSLAILHITDKNMLLKVLSPTFYKPLIENSEFQNTTNKLKLMNLKAVLKNSYPECVFGCDLFLDPLEIPLSSEIQSFRKHVLKVLSNFVPKDKYLCTSQSTDMGIFIDAEFIMDKNLKPLPLFEYGILSKVTDTKPLPFGARRIALMILFFKDFTLCTPKRTGYNDLAIRLLYSHGFTPVPVSYDEFMRNNTEVKKAKYLLQKISSIMQNVAEKDYKFNIKTFD